MAEPLKKQVQYLKENGFTEQQAHALIYLQTDFVESHLATKADIAMVKKDIAMVKKDIEMLKKDIEMLKKDIEVLKKDLTIRLGSIMVGGIVVLGVIIQLLN